MNLRFVSENADAVSTPSLGDGEYEKSLMKPHHENNNLVDNISHSGRENNSVFTAENLFKMLPKKVEPVVSIVQNPALTIPTQLLDTFPSAGSISSSFSISSKSSSRQQKTDNSVFTSTSYVTPTAQTMHHTVKNNAASQVPRLSVLIEKEEFGEVLNASEAFFDKLLLNEKEHLSAFMKSLDDISASVKESIHVRPQSKLPFLKNGFNVCTYTNLSIHRATTN
jgi:hypothetical protein